MITATRERDTEMTRLATLVDRLEVGSTDVCTVPGCVHHPEGTGQQDGSTRQPRRRVDEAESTVVRPMIAASAGFVGSVGLLLTLHIALIV